MPANLGQFERQAAGFPASISLPNFSREDLPVATGAGWQLVGRDAVRKEYGESAGQTKCVNLEQGMMSKTKYKAVIFDLYTALLDSWSLWNRIAGEAELGAVWRKKYLELTYQAGHYRSYDEIIHEAAREVGLTSNRAAALIQAWSTLEPWPETRQVVGAISERVPIGVATNSSIELAEIAVATLGVEIPVVVTAEESGYYKPQPQTYRLALARLGHQAEEVLFVAGSASDVPGAINVGMPVYWHNRIHQRPANERIKPKYELDSLLPLLDLV